MTRPALSAALRRLAEVVDVLPGEALPFLEYDRLNDCLELTGPGGWLRVDARGSVTIRCASARGKDARVTFGAEVPIDHIMLHHGALLGALLTRDDSTP